MLYLFVTAMSALHAFNLIHPKIIKTNCKEAILPLLPLQTSKLYLQQENWCICLWVATSLCPPTVMDETLTWIHRHLSCLFLRPYSLLTQSYRFRQRQWPLLRITKLSMSFSNLRASDKLPIDTNRTVHYNSRILSGFLQRFWHYTGRTDCFILNGFLLRVPKLHEIWDFHSRENLFYSLLGLHRVVC